SRGSGPRRPSGRSPTRSARAGTGRRRPRECGASAPARDSIRDSPRPPGLRGHVGLHGYRAWGIVLGHPEEKGGRGATPAGGAKATGHRLQRRDLVPEPLGDADQRFTIDEDGAEGLIAALRRFLGCEEILGAARILHGVTLRG